jgi:hypothetical protein
VAEDYSHWFWNTGGNLPRRSVRDLAISPWFYQDEHVLLRSAEYPDGIRSPTPNNMQLQDMDHAFPVPPILDQVFNSPTSTTLYLNSPDDRDLAWYSDPDYIFHGKIIGTIRASQFMQAYSYRAKARVMYADRLSQVVLKEQHQRRRAPPGWYVRQWLGLGAPCVEIRLPPPPVDRNIYEIFDSDSSNGQASDDEGYLTYREEVGTIRDDDPTDLD